MTPRHNRFLILAFAVAIVLFALLSLEYIGTALLCGLLLLSLFIPQVDVDTIGQMILALFSLFAAYIIVMVFGTGSIDNPPGELGAIETTTALWILLVSVTRPAVLFPRGGTAGNAGIILLAVLSMGNVRHGHRYPVSALAVLVLLLLAMRMADPGRPQWRVVWRNRRRSLALVLAGTLLISGTLMVALPMLYRYGYQRMMHRTLTPRIGFSKILHLGSLRDVLHSTDVVLRIRGPKPDYLRGFVFSHYLGNSWYAAKEGVAVSYKADASPDDSVTTTIITVSGNRDRFFIPLGVDKIGVPGGMAQVADSGILLPPNNEETETVHFQLALDEGLPQAQLPPTDILLSLPEGIASVLTDIALQWTRDAGSERARLEAIEKHLHEDFRYSLSFERPRGMDPLIAFLTTDRQGHCEYFATAMALLARSLGIPTRVVAGYIVYEENPLGGYYIVRQRNAHTWVEAWTAQNGWQTFEPTPSDQLLADLPRHSSLLPAVIDFIAEAFRLAGAVVADMTLGQIALVAGLLLSAWATMVFIRRRRMRSRSMPSSIRSYSPVPDVIQRLTLTLTAMGQPHRDSEPIDRYVARVVAEIHMGGRGDALADLIAQYNRWRFGAMGDGQSISAGIDLWLQNLPGKEML